MQGETASFVIYSLYCIEFGHTEILWIKTLASRSTEKQPKLTAWATNLNEEDMSQQNVNDQPIT